MSLSLNRAGLALAVRAVLYSPEFSAGLLFALDRARAGEWEPLLSLAGSLSAGVSDSMAIGALLSTCCAEDYQRISAGVVAPSPKGAFLGEAAVELLRSACSVWPHRAAPAGFHEPTTGDAPTLLLSGEFDPVTPPPWAELAAKGLKNAQLRTLAGRGHGTLSAPCARRWLKQFIRAPDKPLSQCEQLGRRPPFWLRRQAPPS